MFNDELIGVFESDPPEASLRDLGSLPEYRVEAASWERDDTWRDVLVSLPEDFKPLECSVHANKDDCKKDHALDRVKFTTILFSEIFSYAHSGRVTVFKFASNLKK